jgi:hypothetical protein
MAFSPQTKYTDCVTAAASEVVPTFAGTGRCVVSATDGFLYRTRYFFFHVALELSSRS